MRVPVDLRLVADEVLRLVGSSAVAKGVTLHVELGEQPLVIPGDPGELDRLLTNLVSNAVKYTAPGGVVTVSMARRDDAAGSVSIHVADDGLGISEEDQHQLFKEFFRSNNPEARSRPGTGLGLVIVDRLVRRHAGVLSLTSALGHGTTVTVRLPAAS